MICTEVEAKDKFCHATFTSNTKHTFYTTCHDSKCMAWRWELPKEPAESKAGDEHDA